MSGAPINLDQKFSMFNEHWSPKSVASFNCQDVMVAKVRGECNRRKHDVTYDLFLVLLRELAIHFRDQDIILGPGELYVIPKGVDHNPLPRMKFICCL